jgi:hypothetical protein
MTERGARCQLPTLEEILAHHVLRERTEHVPWVSLFVSSASISSAYIK